jgi:hypothetical protein
MGMHGHTDAGMDACTDVGTDAWTNTGTDICTDTGTDVGTGAGMDMGTHAVSLAHESGWVGVCWTTVSSRTGYVPLYVYVPPRIVSYPYK